MWLLSQNLKKRVTGENVLYFMALFSLLAFRTPADLFTPYLWAEDGKVLIHGAIYDGLKGLAMPGNGAYWVIQRALGLSCYWLVRPFGNIVALPYVMQVLAKALHVLAVMYFMSERFVWFVPKKIYRFAICAGIILFMPYHASDVLTCETSLPFGLFFGAFLIGLDLLCSGRYEIPNIGQTVYLTLLALSIASAPCIGVLAVAAVLQWAACHLKKVKKKGEKTGIGIWAVACVRLCVILAAVGIQTECVVSSGRVSRDLELLHRVLLNTKSFMFFPYWNLFHSWAAFFGGAAIWVIVLYLTRIPWRVVAYCGGFSYLYMFYCCMVGKAGDMYVGLMAGRYVFTCFEIAAFLCGIAMVRLWERQCRIGKHIAFVAGFAAAIMALRTYDVSVIQPEVAQAYKAYSGVFDAEGEDCVWIPIAPWRPWALDIPADISRQPVVDDLEFGVEYLDNKLTGTEGFGVLDDKSFWDISGWARTGTKNQRMKRLLLKKGNSYIATTELTVREWFHDEKIEHNGFKFHVGSANNASVMWLQDGVTTLELVGETDDGVWHSGRMDIQTAFIK